MTEANQDYDNQSFEAPDQEDISKHNNDEQQQDDNQQLQGDQQQYNNDGDAAFNQ